MVPSVSVTGEPCTCAVHRRPVGAVRVTGQGESGVGNVSGTLPNFLGVDNFLGMWYTRVD